MSVSSAFAFGMVTGAALAAFVLAVLATLCWRWLPFPLAAGETGTPADKARGAASSARSIPVQQDGDRGSQGRVLSFPERPARPSTRLSSEGESVCQLSLNRGDSLHGFRATGADSPTGNSAA